jgi:hypothetical protein
MDSDRWMKVEVNRDNESWAPLPTWPPSHLSLHRSLILPLSSSPSYALAERVLTAYQFFVVPGMFLNENFAYMSAFEELALSPAPCRARVPRSCPRASAMALVCQTIQC